MKQATPKSKIIVFMFLTITTVILLADKRQLTPEEQQDTVNRQQRLKAITTCKEKLLEYSNNSAETCASCYDVKEHETTINVFIGASNKEGDKMPALCIFDRKLQQPIEFYWQ